MQVGAQRGGPRRTFGGDALKENAHDALTAEADAPHEIVLGGGVVNRQFGLSRGEHAPGALHHVFLEAAAADRAEPGVVGQQEQAGAGPAVGRALDLYQRRQRRGLADSGVEGGENAGDFRHEAREVGNH